MQSPSTLRCLLCQKSARDDPGAAIVRGGGGCCGRPPVYVDDYYEAREVVHGRVVIPHRRVSAFVCSQCRIDRIACCNSCQQPFSCASDALARALRDCRALPCCTPLTDTFCDQCHQTDRHGRRMLRVHGGRHVDEWSMQCTTCLVRTARKCPVCESAFDAARVLQCPVCRVGYELCTACNFLLAYHPRVGRYVHVQTQAAACEKGEASDSFVDYLKTLYKKPLNSLYCIE